MAVGLAPAVANALLDALINQTNYTAPTAIWMQLHTADPGAAGTAAIAGNATRKDITAAFANAAGGAGTNNVDIAWTGGEVDSNEDYTHYSVWTLVSGGTFLWSGLVTANAVIIGDQFKILAGDLDLTFNVAA
jgi:hypothetical protein